MKEVSHVVGTCKSCVGEGGPVDGPCTGARWSWCSEGVEKCGCYDGSAKWRVSNVDPPVKLKEGGQ